MAVLDSGIVEAIACRDTYLMVSMLAEQAYRYVYVEKDYKKAIEAHLRAIAIREDEGLCYSLGIAMGLLGNDSASYYMDRSIELVTQKKIRHAWYTIYAIMHSYCLTKDKTMKRR